MTSLPLTSMAVTSMTLTSLTVLAAEGDRLPEDVGKSGPLGLLLILVLLTATLLLVRSMSKHLKKLPRSFDAGADDADDMDRIDVPDTPAELIDHPAKGQDVLDALRRAPRAIEPPRRPDGRPADPA